MKIFKILAFLLLPAWLFAACGTDDSDKTQCKSDADCVSEYSCNLARADDGSLAQIGQCMKIGNSGSFLCGTDNPCPAGQFCWNGLCALGCMSDQDCADNQYCDTRVDLPNNQFGTHMCVNKEVAGCSTDADCEETQTCMNGTCGVASEDHECTPRFDGPDGCDEFSICIDHGDEVEDFRCFSFSPCPQDGNCPVGLYGAVCNDGYFPEKAPICLTTGCITEENCPSSFKCIIPQGTLGVCSDGSAGALCMAHEDCDSGLTCSGLEIANYGLCIPGGQSSCEEAGGTCVDAMTGCPAGTTPSAETCPTMGDICCK